MLWRICYRLAALAGNAKFIAFAELLGNPAVPTLLKSLQSQDWDCELGQPSKWPVLRLWLRAGFTAEHITLSSDRHLVFRGRTDLECGAWMRLPSCPAAPTHWRPPPTLSRLVQEMIGNQQVCMTQCPLGFLALELRRWECALHLCGPAGREAMEIVADRAWLPVLREMPILVLTTTRWPILLILLRIQALVPLWARTSDRFLGGRTSNCSKSGANSGGVDEAAQCAFFYALDAAIPSVSDSIELNPPHATLVGLAEQLHGLGLRSPRAALVFPLFVEMHPAMDEFVKHMREGGASFLSQTASQSLVALRLLLMRNFVTEGVFLETTILIEKQVRTVQRLLRQPAVIASLAICTQCWPVFHILALIGTLAFRAYGSLRLASWALEMGPFMGRGAAYGMEPAEQVVCQHAESGDVTGKRLRIAQHVCRFFSSSPAEAVPPRRLAALVAVAYGSLAVRWLVGFLRRTRAAVRGSLPLVLACMGDVLCNACAGEDARERWLLCVQHELAEEAFQATGIASGRTSSLLTSEEAKVALCYGTVLALIALGVDALYLDLDVYLLRNPLPGLQRLAYGDAGGPFRTAAAPKVYANGVPLAEEMVSKCTRQNHVDAVVSEHFHARCLNSGLFYVRASQASVLWMLRYLTWAHTWPLGAEQNIFDASLGHSAKHEPYAPPSVQVPGQSADCPAVTYRLMDVRREFLLSAGGGELSARSPWWEAGGANATSVHFLSPEWKNAAGGLFGAWAAGKGRAAEAILPELLAPWRGAAPYDKPLCYYGRLDSGILEAAHRVVHR